MERQSEASGTRVAVAAGSPLAVAAALEVAAAGGGAVDAVLAAQAALAVALPEACGLGGDALLLVHTPDGEAVAVNGTGRSAADPAWEAASDGGGSVTVPGLPGAWAVLAERARLPLAQVLAPAVRLARDGVVLDAPLAAARDAQLARLRRGGAGDWALATARVGDVVRHPELADVLEHLGAHGAASFYAGPLADALCAAVQRDGGRLVPADLAAHDTPVLAPLAVPWDGGEVLVQPPVAQGVLLACALAWLERAGDLPDALPDHLGVELTEAVFALRDRVPEGAALLDVPLDVHPTRAQRRGGPRAYLHTTAACAADADGTVVSSLVSVFDDFGSGTFVPEGGFVLNDRAGGFTAGANAPAPGRRPVHTLAPALLRGAGGVTGLATPGADGQVQTLLQVLTALRGGDDLAAAVAAPRWRTQGGRLHVEDGHPVADRLRAAGHHVVATPRGDALFGALAAAGVRDGRPVAVADWRRQVAAGGL